MNCGSPLNDCVETKNASLCKSDVIPPQSVTYPKYLPFAIIKVHIILENRAGGQGFALTDNPRLL